MDSKTVTITIEYEPLETGTDTPQDVLDEAAQAVTRRGGRIVKSEAKG